MKYRNVLLFISFLILPLLLLSCTRYEKKEVEVYYLNTAGKDKITLVNVKGNVKITKGDSLGLLVVKAEKWARVRKRDLDRPMENLNVVLDTASSEISIEGEFERRRGFFVNFGIHREEINFELRVPENIKMKVSNTNGEVDMRGIGNELDISVVNGSMNFEKLTGTVSLDVTNGKLNGAVDSSRGMKLVVVNGSVNLNIDSAFNGAVHAGVVNGKITRENLNFTNVTEDRKSFKGILGTAVSEIYIDVTNGKIRLLGK